MKQTPLKRKTPLRAKTSLVAGEQKRKTKKKGDRSWFIAKLDDIAKGFAKERDGYFCQYSGQNVEGSNAHGSHVIPVSAGQSLRWDLLNIKCLSYHNHLNWWHKNPIEAAEWFKSRFPERWRYLQTRRAIMQSGRDRKITTPKLAEFYELAVKCKNWEEYDILYSHSLGRMAE